MINLGYQADKIDLCVFNVITTLRDARESTHGGTFCFRTTTSRRLRGQEAASGRASRPTSVPGDAGARPLG